MEDKFRKNNSYIYARKRLNKLKGFYHHLFWYVIVNVFVIGFICTKVDNISDIWNFGTFSTAIFWGIGVFFHAVGVFGKNIFFSKSWEEKKIKQFMNEDKS